MSEWDWNPYLVGGATRSDAISGTNPSFLGQIQRMIEEAPEDIRQNIRLLSAYRSPEIQAQLWQDALARYGSEAEARRWVAPPGNSHHNHGTAIDLRYLDPSAQDYFHANANRYGLHFPLSNEPWHVEPMAEGGGRLTAGTDWTYQQTPGALSAAPQGQEQPRQGGILSGLIEALRGAQPAPASDAQVQQGQQTPPPVLSQRRETPRPRFLALKAFQEAFNPRRN